jgi:predicted transcriptional regulator of viral defense system
MRSRRIQLTELERNILKYITENELFCFHFDDLKNSNICNDKYELQDALSRLTKFQSLYRIEKGLYCVWVFQNSYVIANALLKNSTVAYWTALNIHGLTEQIPNTIYSQSTFRKNDKTVFGVLYKFIKVKPEKMLGTMEMGYGSETFRVTDVEKTLLDCFDLPQYSGGYEELIRAFYTAKINSLKLLKYGKQIGNLSVLKRMAFLSELFEMKKFDKFQQGVMSIMNEKYSLLDPMGENTGDFDAKWHIRINISKERLLGVINKIY